MMSADDLSPMMRQYHEAKKSCPGAIVLFRMGDFYELFHEDARLCAQVLGLALTSRTKGDNPIPMAGFPQHQLESYIGKLIAAGYRAAVCEQVEDPKKLPKGQSLVKREVVRIVSPGTVTDETILDPKQYNYLAACVLSSSATQNTKTGHSDGVPFQSSFPATNNTPVGLAWVELSTGNFFATTVSHSTLADSLAQIAPSECLIPENEYAATASGNRQELRLPVSDGMMITKRPDWAFGVQTSLNTLYRHFGVKSMEGFGFHTEDSPEDMLSLRAAGAIIEYLNETQKQSLSHLDSLSPYRQGGFLEMDEATRRSLEIGRTIRRGSREGSLLGVLDRCMTPMGSRLLSEWVARPLTRKKDILHRQEAVAQFVANDSVPRKIREKLRQIYDMQRLLTKILQNRATPRDLVMVVKTLRVLPEFRSLLAESPCKMIADLAENIHPCDELCHLLTTAIVQNDCPLSSREGGFIRSGFHQELDNIRNLQHGGKQWIAQYQAAQIARTGIHTLKVGFTTVFGYYLEITNANREKIPSDYLRKQTLKNAERYITPELKEYEEKVLTAGERVCELEYEIFCYLRDQVAQARAPMQRTADALSQLDVLTSLAVLARDQGYCCPEITEDVLLEIVDGRHPVLDLVEPAGAFIPNDTHSGGSGNGGREDNRENHGFIHLITGPNMAGKSTFIRQVALLTLMAQLGSFIPAKSAKIGIVDRIFARVGASDELSKGQSTFMVEMTETARILRTASQRSLVILDEIGRGTSTYDGISLAWAIVEYLHDTIGCRTFFATHYHELTDLAESFEGIENLNVAVREHNEDIVFLHKIVPGSADKSYGIHVARLAGVPREVIHRARNILTELESTHLRGRPAIAAGGDDTAVEAGILAGMRTHSIRKKTEAGVFQFSLFGPEDHPVLEAIRRQDVSNLTPLESLKLLSQWHDQLAAADKNGSVAKSVGEY